MNSRKPDLLKVRARRRWVHQILAEKCAALINRYRVPQIRDSRQRRGIGQAPAFRVDRIENPSDRADRIPQPEEMRRARHAERAFKTPGDFELAWIVALIESHDVWNERLI